MIVHSKGPQHGHVGESVRWILLGQRFRVTLHELHAHFGRHTEIVPQRRPPSKVSVEQIGVLDKDRGQRRS